MLRFAHRLKLTRFGARTRLVQILYAILALGIVCFWRVSTSFSHVVMSDQLIGLFVA